MHADPPQTHPQIAYLSLPQRLPMTIAQQPPSGVSASCVGHLQDAPRRRAIGYSRRAFWGLGYPDYSTQGGARGLVGTSPWSKGYISWKESPVKSGVRREPVTREAGPLHPERPRLRKCRENNQGQGRAGRVGEASWRSKCLSPIFPCRGSIRCKIEVRDLINLTYLSQM